MNLQYDTYTAIKKYPITYTPNPASYNNSPSTPPAALIGTLACSYTVKVVNVVANAGITSGYQRSYLITCTQRLVLNNPTTPSTNLPLYLQAGGSGMINVGPNSANPTTNDYAFMSGVLPGHESTYLGYYCYPVWAMVNVTFSASTTASAPTQVWLQNYQPRTLNSTVNISNSTGQSASSGSSNNYANSTQTTRGASNSTVQSYDVTLSMGLGLGANEGISGGLSRSIGQQTSHSNSRSHSHGSTLGGGSNNGHGNQVEQNASMAIKDWGIFSCLNSFPSQSTTSSAPSIPSCSWFFSQEYPYNFLSSNSKTNQSTNPNPFPFSLQLTSAEIANLFPEHFNNEKQYSISPPVSSQCLELTLC